MMGMLRMSPDEPKDGVVSKAIDRSNRTKRSATVLSKAKSSDVKSRKAAVAKVDDAPAPAKEKEYDVSNAPRAIAIDMTPTPRRSPSVPSAAPSITPARKASSLPGMVPAVGVIGNPQGI
jgi:hypothetical protein